MVVLNDERRVGRKKFEVVVEPIMDIDDSHLIHARPTRVRGESLNKNLAIMKII